MLNIYSLPTALIQLLWVGNLCMPSTSIRHYIVSSRFIHVTCCLRSFDTRRDLFFLSQYTVCRPTYPGAGSTSISHTVDSRKSIYWWEYPKKICCLLWTQLYRTWSLHCTEIYPRVPWWRVQGACYSILAQLNVVMLWCFPLVTIACSVFSARPCWSVEVDIQWTMTFD